MPDVRPLLILLFLILASPLFASTYLVNDLGDTPDTTPGNNLCETASNVCTLRAAIEEANAHTGTDTIRFSVAGTITPLPLVVSDAVDLDATTAPGYSSSPMLVLSGPTASIQFAPGSSNSVIAGFKFEGSAALGALTISSSNVTIRRNHLGPIGGGTSNLHGILLDSTSASCTIGGNGADDGNVISGNVTGVVVAGNGHTIAGNRIGTDATGSSAIPNNIGIHTIGGSNHQIFRNLISGNDQWGVLLESSGTQLSDNIIGRTANNGALPNALGGAHLAGSNIRVAGNVIASNAGPGISVANSGSANYFVFNSIFENAGLGIDLLDDAGPTPNDALDTDAGGNGLQNFPVISDVIAVPTASTVAGSLHSTPLTGFTLYFYTSNAAGPSGLAEARTHIGTRNVFSEPDGNANFNWIGPALTPGHVVTATASGPDGTSEFSKGRAVVAGPAIFFSPVIYTIPESAGSVTLKVRREGDLTGTSTVFFAAGSESADHGADFVLSGAMLTFGPAVAERTIIIPIVVDAIEEPRETFTVRLLNSTAAAITANVATIVIDPHADLSVAKSTSVSGARDLTFGVTVVNLGPDAATNVTMSDVLPAGTTLISATPTTGSCNGTTTIVCTFGALTANTGVSVQIVTSWNGAMVTNTATADASEIDPNPGNNSDSAAVAAAIPTESIPTASTGGLLALMLILTLIGIVRIRA